jgi:hypothetical protein
MTEKTNLPVTQDNDFNFDPADFGEMDAKSREDNAGPQSPAPNAIKIKYNGAEEAYDLATQQDKVVELMQKGRNYDKIMQERDALQGAEEIQFMQEQAQEAGFATSKEYMAKLREDMQSHRIEMRSRELEAEGMTPQHAQYTAQLEIKVKQETPRQASPEDTKVEQLRGQFEALRTKYPEVTQFKNVEDFPKPVLDAMQQGLSPLEAYQGYLLETERAKANITAQNQANAQRESGQQEKKEDDFLAGLFGR